MMTSRVPLLYIIAEYSFVYFMREASWHSRCKSKTPHLQDLKGWEYPRPPWPHHCLFVICSRTTSHIHFTHPGCWRNVRSLCTCVHLTVVSWLSFQQYQFRITKKESSLEASDYLGVLLYLSHRMSNMVVVGRQNGFITIGDNLPAAAMSCPITENR